MRINNPRMPRVGGFSAPQPGLSTPTINKTQIGPRREKRESKKARQRRLKAEARAAGMTREKQINIERAANVAATRRARGEGPLSVEDRMRSLQEMIESTGGVVYHSEDANWNSDFRTEEEKERTRQKLMQSLLSRGVEIIDQRGKEFSWVENEATTAELKKAQREAALEAQRKQVMEADDAFFGVKNSETYDDRDDDIFGSSSGSASEDIIVSDYQGVDTEDLSDDEFFNFNSNDKDDDISVDDIFYKSVRQAGRAAVMDIQRTVHEKQKAAKKAREEEAKERAKREKQAIAEAKRSKLERQRAAREEQRLREREIKQRDRDAYRTERESAYKRAREIEAQAREERNKALEEAKTIRQDARKDSENRSSMLERASSIEKSARATANSAFEDARAIREAQRAEAEKRRAIAESTWRNNRVKARERLVARGADQEKINQFDEYTQKREEQYSARAEARKKKKS